MVRAVCFLLAVLALSTISVRDAAAADLQDRALTIFSFDHDRQLHNRLAISANLPDVTAMVSRQPPLSFVDAGRAGNQQFQANQQAVDGGVISRVSTTGDFENITLTVTAPGLECDTIALKAAPVSSAQ